MKARQSLSEKLVLAGQKPKLVYVFLLGVNALSIGASLLLYFLGAGILPSLLLIGGGFGLSVMYFSSLFGKKGKEEKKLLQEFVRIFEYFSIYVKNGFPIYSALESVIPYASSSMEEKLRELLSSIDKDKSVAPFVRFAGYFPSLSIKEVMVSVYLMGEQGGSEAYFRQFSALFDSFASNERKAEMDKSLERQSNLSALPLLGSGLTMLLVTVGLVAIIGGVLNGL